MRRLETIKRVIVLGLSLMGLFIQTIIYAYIWINYYYPIVNDFNRGLKFYRYGHLLIIAIYFIFFLCKYLWRIKNRIFKNNRCIFITDVFSFVCKYYHLRTDFSYE